MRVFKPHAVLSSMTLRSSVFSLGKCTKLGGREGWTDGWMDGQIDRYGYIFCKYRQILQIWILQKQIQNQIDRCTLQIYLYILEMTLVSQSSKGPQHLTFTHPCLGFYRWACFTYGPERSEWSRSLDESLDEIVIYPFLWIELGTQTKISLLNISAGQTHMFISLCQVTRLSFAKQKKILRKLQIVMKEQNVYVCIRLLTLNTNLAVS